MTATVADPVARHRDRVLGALLAALPRGEPASHLYDLLPQYPARPSKAIRPALLMATCAALGGDEERALPFAVGVEMLHNAFLIHDDITDGSGSRRGEPTLVATHGIGLALCAGNTLATEALAVLREASRGRGSATAEAVTAEVETATRRTLEGQAMELGWDRDRRVDVTVADYLDMIRHKTSWYSTILPCRLGALAAGRTLSDRTFVRFGALVGAVLQIGDDLQSLTADRDASGEDFGDDVLEGKRTLAVVHHLSHGPADGRARLVELLSRPREERSRDDAGWVTTLLREHGSLAYAARAAHTLAAEARLEQLRELPGARPSGSSVLAAVVDLLDDRVP
ncbi:MAG TPA: polyprenyl synthetase family protein [Mycobacteriales bacterium]